MKLQSLRQVFIVAPTDVRLASPVRLAEVEFETVLLGSEKVFLVVGPRSTDEGLQALAGRFGVGLGSLLTFRAALSKSDQRGRVD